MTVRQIRLTADSGTTDGTAANKLIESGQDFLTTVVVGMVVLNTVDTTRALVTAVDSDTQLSLDADIMTSGETYTVGGDFTSASSWEAARGGGTLSAPEEGECFDFTDTTVLTINGTVTSAANYMRLFATAGAETNGASRDNTGVGYQLKTTGMLTIGDDHVRLDGIEVQSTVSTSKVLDITAIAAVNDIRIEKCLFVNVGTSSGTFCIDASDPNLLLTWSRNLIVTQLRCCDFRTATVTTDHSGFYGDAGQLGVVSDAGHTVTNSWAMNSSDDWFDGGTNPTGNNNASDDASADPLFTSSLNNRTPATEFVSNSHITSSFDFSLKSGNTIGGQGTDPSGLTDIAGTAYNNPSSIGPFADVAAEIGATLTGQEIVVEQGVLVATGEAQVDLTGQEIAVEQGTLEVAISVTVGLTGQEATVEQGVITVDAETAVDLVGQEITAEQGAVVVEAQSETALTGQEITIEQGTIIAGAEEPDTGNNVVIIGRRMVRLSGVDEAYIAGDRIVHTLPSGSITVFLVGQDINVEQGTITLEIPFAEELVGQEVTVEQGVVVATAESLVDLTGQEFAVEQGVINVDTDVVNLAGQEISIEQGVITVELPSEAVLVGQELTLAQGVLDITISHIAELDGQEFVVEQGIVVATGGTSDSADLIGQEIIVEQGTIIAEEEDSTADLVGQEVVAQQGFVNAGPDVPVAGNKVVIIGRRMVRLNEDSDDAFVVDRAILHDQIPVGSAVVPIDGQEFAVEQGTLVSVTGAAIEPLVGQEIDVQQGTIIIDIPFVQAVAGLEITVEQGEVTLTGESTIELTGIEIPVEQGILGFPFTEFITGQEFNVQQGSIIVLADDIIFLLGQGMEVQQGNLISVTGAALVELDGQEIVVEQGTVQIFIGDSTPLITFAAVKPKRAYVAIKPRRSYDAVKLVNIL